MNSFRIKLLASAMVVIVSVATAYQVDAGSIWKRRNFRSANLFVDNRARRVGDLVTVRIRELTTIDNDEDRQLNKQTDKKQAFEFKAGSVTNGPRHEVSVDDQVEGTSTRNYQTTSQFGSDRLFADEITVTVVDLLPNGNLLVEGMRQRLISGENRVIRLSGVIRPDDIEFLEEGNFIDSRFIAKFRIAYEGSGIETKFTKQGWMSRFWNKAWPF